MECTGPWDTAGDVISNVAYYPDVPVISFTGETTTGKLIMTHRGGHSGRLAQPIRRRGDGIRG